MQKSTSSERKLTAILFADIAGYTSLMQNDEKKALGFLEKFRKEMEARVPASRGKIVQFYGDGCLSVFNSPVDAVNCGKELQLAFQLEPAVPVRIGIHSGDVIIKEGNIFGDSVNVASRIESLGVPGAVLFSKRIKRHIANHPEFKVESLGEFDFKNVNKTMEVFALANEGLVVPKREEMIGKLKSAKPQRPKWSFAGLAAILLMVAGYFWFFSKNDSNISENEPPSIAILPFADLSPNKDQAYFADGIAEEILNTLSQLTELKVAGKSSSFSFKEKEATIKEIGNALSVNHVLEGSVRKQGIKIRISVQLVKAEDGFQLWSRKYDRDFDDIFEIQDEVAQNIGKALLENLAPEQISKLTTNPGYNSEAYDLFLKARHIHLNRYLAKYKVEDFNTSEQLLQQAIALDSNYALAHAELALLYDTHFLMLEDSLELKKYEQLKNKEAEIAYRLAPDNDYVNVARGWALVSSARDSTDFNAAYQSFLKAYQLNPQSPHGLLGLCHVYFIKSLVEDALKFLDKAIDLDPLLSQAYYYKESVYYYSGDIAASINVLKAHLGFAPENEPSLRNLAERYAFTNKNEEALEIISQLQNRDSTLFKRYPKYKKLAFVLKGDFDNVKKISGFENLIPYVMKDWNELEERNKAFLGDPQPKEREEFSAYLQMLRNPIFDSMREKPWFKEALKREKEKYEKFYQEYPRAESIIGTPIKG